MHYFQGSELIAEGKIHKVGNSDELVKPRSDMMGFNCSLNIDFIVTSEWLFSETNATVFVP